MTLKEWERRLNKSLKDCSKEEKKKILDYYREIYGDKLDAGMEEERILDEFGAPEECANKLLVEEGRESSPPPIKKERKSSSVSPAQIVGMVFLTLTVLIPIFASLFAVVVGFASVALAGGASAIAGVVYAVFAPFLFGYYGASFWGIFTGVGVGIATLGVGLILVVFGYYATKYTAIATIWLFKKIYFRREQR